MVSGPNPGQAKAKRAFLQFIRHFQLYILLDGTLPYSFNPSLLSTDRRTCSPFSLHTPHHIFRIMGAHNCHLGPQPLQHRHHCGVGRVQRRYLLPDVGSDPGRGTGRGNADGHNGIRDRHFGDRGHGGLPVTARGVCGETSANATMSGSHMTDGSGAWDIYKQHHRPVGRQDLPRSRLRDPQRRDQLRRRRDLPNAVSGPHNYLLFAERRIAGGRAGGGEHGGRVSVRGDGDLRWRDGDSEDGHGNIDRSDDAGTTEEDLTSTLREQLPHDPALSHLPANNSSAPGPILQSKQGPETESRPDSRCRALPFASRGRILRRPRRYPLSQALSAHPGEAHREGLPRFAADRSKFHFLFV